MKLLRELCAIHAPSGSEKPMTDFLLDYIKKHQKSWKVKPKIHSGGDLQDCIVLVFGKPRTAIFAHIDSIGFTTRYETELVKIGGPVVKDGWKLVGKDSKGAIECTLKVDKDKNPHYAFKRKIDRATTLTFKPDFRESKDYVQCCYMDNRLGVWNALQVAETLENGIIAFSTYEEHGGGTVGFLAGYIYEKFKVKQALISDITWVTNGVLAGKGVAVSMRDSGIPRRTYLERVVAIAHKSKVPFQIEVEFSGGSDGNQLQKAPFPFDWCFVGAPESNVHTPDEKVNKKDIAAMTAMYKALMKDL
jgi:putative aminopeptidase FrvX